MKIVVIKVNNIDVGSMPIEDYEKIVKDIRADCRNRILYVLSHINSIWKMAKKIISCFAMSYAAFFVIMMIYLYLNHAETVNFIELLRTSSSESIAKGIHNITNLSIVYSILYCTIPFLIKGEPVFQSAFDRAINNKIREVMEVPAEGEVSVHIAIDNGNQYRVR